MMTSKVYEKCGIQIKIRPSACRVSKMRSEMTKITEFQICSGFAAVRSHAVLSVMLHKLYFLLAVKAGGVRVSKKQEAVPAGTNTRPTGRDKASIVSISKIHHMDVILHKITNSKFIEEMDKIVKSEYFLPSSFPSLLRLKMQCRFSNHIQEFQKPW
ncbi:hypothetical protein CIB84_001099 [Bambusicola thoracicus]|uniref:Uncharacterized protein n=1 Tax=Bambusicola thoracicus TaxID=9083 RepID=A0A2P4TFN1_BAMTH|nr:hypothetical protein CIB84_001099 [Bambusicola thoracicus]